MMPSTLFRAAPGLPTRTPPNLTAAKEAVPVGLKASHQTLEELANRGELSSKVAAESTIEPSTTLGRKHHKDCMCLPRPAVS